jgi:hypothetical protein
LDKDARTLIRKRFHGKKSQLLNLINDIISNVEAKTGKELVLIVDDLEKMRSEKQMQELFIMNRSILEEIRCRKILTYPVHLIFDPSMTFQLYERFTLRVQDPPGHKNDPETVKGRERLRNVAYKRLANKQLITSDALELAIDYSAGIIRQFIHILRMAGTMKYTQNPDSIVDKNDILQAVKWFRREYSTRIIGNVKLLKYIKDHHKLPEGELPYEKEDFIRLVLGSLVLVYFNDNAWYDINPIIADAVEEYARTVK